MCSSLIRWVVFLFGKSRCNDLCHHGRCYQCGLRWCQVDPHETTVDESGGLFCLCKSCWRHITPNEVTAAYAQLLEHHDKQYARAAPEWKITPQWTHREIMNAVVTEKMG